MGRAGRSYVFHVLRLDAAGKREMVVTFPATGADSESYSSLSITLTSNSP